MQHPANNHIVVSTGEVIAPEVSGVGAEATVVTSHNSQVTNNNTNTLSNNEVVSNSKNHFVKGK